MMLRGLGGRRTSPRSSRWRRPPSGAKAGKALEEASRIQISVHGGIGATFEHDAPLYFRKAQLSRRLLGGTAGRVRPRRRRAVRPGRQRGGLTGTSQRQATARGTRRPARPVAFQFSVGTTVRRPATIASTA